MELRPNQISALAQLDDARKRGVKRVCITSPTGGGKTFIVVKRCQDGRPSVIYGNRIILNEQMFESMIKHGLGFGVQASGYEESVLENLQVASIQTVAGRVEAGEMSVHPAEEVFIDEAHDEKSKRARRIIDEHEKAGAQMIIGLTATPVGIGQIYDELIVAGTNSELRDYGALVPANTYAPDEPSMKAFKSKTRAVMQLKDEVREVMLHTIYGRVKENMLRINPDLKPVQLFAPDVAASAWMAEKLWSHNIPAAHIDNKRIWINGETILADRDGRKRLRNASETGEVRVTCNRFILRTGVDWPHIFHVIFACTFGSCGPYLQAGGRGLRALFDEEMIKLWGPKTCLLCQDHGGNYWRHDSLNVDRVWDLNKSEDQYQQERFELYRTKAAPEPFACPRCSRLRKADLKCPYCGFISKVKTRRIIETNGTLREVTGDIFHPRRVVNSEHLHNEWKSTVMRCRNSGKTMGQARGLFMHEHGGLSPGPEYPMYPTAEGDWYRLASKVFPRRTSSAPVETQREFI